MTSAVVHFLKPVRAFAEGESDPFADRIRVTDAGLISIIDVIANISFRNDDGTLMEKASARASEYFARLRKSHEEVTTLCGHFRFPGQGQRDTPVTDRLGMINIIQLLPGRKADTFRRSLGILATKYLDADEEFVQSVLDRYKEKTGRDFPMTREQLNQYPRIQAAESNKQDMRAIRDSSASKVPCHVYAAVNNTANQLATGYNTTAEYRKDQGLTKKSQATRDTFNDEMSSLMDLFHRRHARLVEKGGDPVVEAAKIRESLAPGLRSIGYYEDAREVRGAEFAKGNKRLMEINRVLARDEAKRIKA
eukprot:jgi/Mesvir1/18308/Mv25750-RA.1